MSVADELQIKVDVYFDEHEEFQDDYDDIEKIKDQVSTKVYFAKKLLELDLEIDDLECTYSYFSKDHCDLQINTNSKILYKNKPFFFIDKNLFDLSYFEDEENIFYTYLLFALNQKWNEINDENTFWFFSPECALHEESIKYFFQFVLLSNGYSFHKPVGTRQNQFLEKDIKEYLDCNKNFNQYIESAYILSEYNNTDDILLKYLLLYHIIENFMYRRPIAEMANKKFTIRDFKRLYKHIDHDEISTLLTFFKTVSSNQLCSNVTLETYVNSSLKHIRDEGILDIYRFIHLLGFDFQNLKYMASNKKVAWDFRRFIYLLRNSIVHNKETEFHITHNTFQEFPDLIKLFEELLFPILENIIYYLIFKEDSIIDYPKNHLLLYGEHCET